MLDVDTEFGVRGEASEVDVRVDEVVRVVTVVVVVVASVAVVVDRVTLRTVEVVFDTGSSASDISSASTCLASQFIVADRAKGMKSERSRTSARALDDLRTSLPIAAEGIGAYCSLSNGKKNEARRVNNNIFQGRVLMCIMYHCPNKGLVNGFQVSIKYLSCKFL